MWKGSDTRPTGALVTPPPPPSSDPYKTPTRRRHPGTDMWRRGGGKKKDRTRSVGTPLTHTRHSVIDAGEMSNIRLPLFGVIGDRPLDFPRCVICEPTTRVGIETQFGVCGLPRAPMGRVSMPTLPTIRLVEDTQQPPPRGWPYIFADDLAASVGRPVDVVGTGVGFDGPDEMAVLVGDQPNTDKYGKTVRVEFNNGPPGIAVEVSGRIRVTAKGLSELLPLHLRRQLAAAIVAQATPGVAMPPRVDRVDRTRSPSPPSRIPRGGLSPYKALPHRITGRGGLQQLSPVKLVCVVVRDPISETWQRGFEEQLQEKLQEGGGAWTVLRADVRESGRGWDVPEQPAGVSVAVIILGTAGNSYRSDRYAAIVRGTESACHSAEGTPAPICYVVLLTNGQTEDVDLPDKAPAICIYLDRAGNIKNPAAPYSDIAQAVLANYMRNAGPPARPRPTSVQYDVYFLDPETSADVWPAQIESPLQRWPGIRAHHLRMAASGLTMDGAPFTAAGANAAVVIGIPNGSIATVKAAIDRTAAIFADITIVVFRRTPADVGAFAREVRSTVASGYTVRGFVASVSGIDISHRVCQRITFPRPVASDVSGMAQLLMYAPEVPLDALATRLLQIGIQSRFINPPSGWQRYPNHACCAYTVIVPRHATFDATLMPSDLDKLWNARPAITANVFVLVFVHTDAPVVPKHMVTGEPIVVLRYGSELIDKADWLVEQHSAIQQLVTLIS